MPVTEIFYLHEGASGEWESVGYCHCYRHGACAREALKRLKKMHRRTKIVRREGGPPPTLCLCKVRPGPEQATVETQTEEIVHEQGSSGLCLVLLSVLVSATVAAGLSCSKCSHFIM